MIINCFVKKASIHAGSGDMDKVKSCFDKCLVIDRSSPDALIHRARVSIIEEIIMKAWCIHE